MTVQWLEKAVRDARTFIAAGEYSATNPDRFDAKFPQRYSIPSAIKRSIAIQLPRPSPAMDQVRRSSWLQGCAMVRQVMNGGVMIHFKTGKKILFLDGKTHFRLYNTDRSIPFEFDAIPTKEEALALLDQTIAIIDQQPVSDYVYVPPFPPGPTPTPDPDPDTGPPPAPIVDWKIIDGQGGLVDLRNWKEAVGDNKQRAFIHNAKQIRYWQVADGRVKFFLRADGLYQANETHATGQCFVATSELENIGFGGSVVLKGAAGLATENTWNYPEPVAPDLAPAMPPEFRPNPFGFTTTEGLTMSQFERIDALIGALNDLKVDPDSITNSRRSLSVANAIVTLTGDDEAIINSNTKVQTFLATLLPSTFLAEQPKAV